MTEGQDQGPLSSSKEDKNLVSASRVGFDFVATVIVMTGFGWLGDRFLGTRPVGILGMFFLGFALGLWTIWRSLNTKT